MSNDDDSIFAYGKQMLKQYVVVFTLDSSLSRFTTAIYPVGKTKVSTIVHTYVLLVIR